MKFFCLAILSLASTAAASGIRFDKEERDLQILQTTAKRDQSTRCPRDVYEAFYNDLAFALTADGNCNTQGMKKYFTDDIIGYFLSSEVYTSKEAVELINAECKAAVKANGGPIDDHTITPEWFMEVEDNVALTFGRHFFNGALNRFTAGFIRPPGEESKEDWKIYHFHLSADPDEN